MYFYSELPIHSFPFVCFDYSTHTHRTLTHTYLHTYTSNIPTCTYSLVYAYIYIHVVVNIKLHYVFKCGTVVSYNNCK